jgi:hypothetical protein
VSRRRSVCAAVVIAVACGGPQELGGTGATCFRDDDCKAGTICVAPKPTDIHRVCSKDPTPLISMVEGPPPMTMGGVAGMSGMGGAGTAGAGTAGAPAAGTDTGGNASAGNAGASGKAGSGGAGGSSAGGTDSAGTSGSSGTSGTAGTAPDGGAPP